MFLKQIIRKKLELNFEFAKSWVKKITLTLYQVNAISFTMQDSSSSAKSNLLLRKFNIPLSVMHYLKPLNVTGSQSLSLCLPTGTSHLTKWSSSLTLSIVDFQNFLLVFKSLSSLYESLPPPKTTQFLFRLVL